MKHGTTLALAVTLGAAALPRCYHHDPLPGLCDDAGPECNNGVPSLTGHGGPGVRGDDAGTSADGDAGTVFGPVQGQLFVAQVLPIPADPSALRFGGGWSVTPVPQPVPAASAAIADNASGAFSIDRVPSTSGGYTLRATPGSSALLDALEDFSAGSAQFVTVSTDALESAASSAGLAVDHRRAHLVVALSGPVPTLAGVVVALAGVRDATVAYDLTGAQLSASATATGSRGTAVLLNFTAPGVNVPVTVVLQRGTTSVSYSVTVAPGAVSWLAARAP